MRDGLVLTRWIEEESKLGFVHPCLLRASRTLAARR